MPQRTRSMTTLSDPLIGKLTSYNRWSPSQITTNFTSMRQEKVGKTTVDVVTPGYFKLKKAGAILPVNELTITQSSCQGTDADALWFYGKFLANGTPDPNYNGSFTKFSGALARHYLGNVSMLAIPQPKPSRLLDMATQDALGRARTKSWDFLTFLAEFHETRDLVEKVTQRTVKRAARIYKHGKPETVNQFLSMWMEGRYGWRLLAYDIEEMNDAIGRLQEGIPDIYRSGVDYLEPLTSTTTTTYPDTMYWKNGGATGMINANVSAKLVKKVSTFNRIHASVGVKTAGRGLAFADPLVTLFDVIPLSMILEWISNIGDLIAAWSPFATQEIAWSSVSVETVSQVEYTATPISRDALVTGVNIARNISGGSSTFILESSIKRRFQRDPGVDLSFRNSFDWPKLVDLSAILYSRKKGLMKFLTQSYYAARSPLEAFVRRVL